MKRYWSDEDHATAMTMWQQGASDYAIGQAIGRTGSGVTFWRKKNKLAANWTGRIGKSECREDYGRGHWKACKLNPSVEHLRLAVEHGVEAGLLTCMADRRVPL